MAKFQPLFLSGLPDHIVKGVVILSDDTTGYFVTGTDLIIDLGLMLHPAFGMAAIPAGKL